MFFKSRKMRILEMQHKEKMKTLDAQIMHELAPYVFELIFKKPKGK